MADMGGFYGVASTRLPILLGDDRELLIVVVDREPVGFLDLDTDQEVSDVTNLTYFIAADRRRPGLGLRALSVLTATYPDRRFVASVRPDNVGSLALAFAAGFIRSSVNQWGDLELTYPGVR